MARNKWYQRHIGRLKAEQIIMRERFPQFVLKEDKGRLLWEGMLITNFGTYYRVKITYPANYPYEKPKLEVVRPRIKTNTPHLFHDRSLCVYPDHWDHKRCTAPAGVPLVASWLAMYEIWLRTGKGW